MSSLLRNHQPRSFCETQISILVSKALIINDNWPIILAIHNWTVPTIQFGDALSRGDIDFFKCSFLEHFIPIFLGFPSSGIDKDPIRSYSKVYNSSSFDEYTRMTGGSYPYPSRWCDASICLCLSLQMSDSSPLGLDVLRENVVLHLLVLWVMRVWTHPFLQSQTICWIHVEFSS